MQLDTIKKLTNESSKRFSTKQEHHDFLMFEIQHHLVEINDLVEKKDPHAKKEMIDLGVLSFMLALNNDANSKIFDERLKKFGKKIKS